MKKKFELTSEFITNCFGKKLFRIRALRSFGSVKKWDLGGFAEKEENIDQSGDAWVYGDAEVYGNAWVYGNAKVTGNAAVYDNAKVYGIASVTGDVEVSGDAEVSGDWDYATVKGFGRYWRNTTFYRGQDKKIHVVCGCFRGDLDAFRKQVKETHGDNKYAKEYLMIADLMEMHFKEGDNGK